MAFKFTWPTFSSSFYEKASNLLTSALSKAPTPPIITDNIVVKEFNLGSVAPDLEMLEIGELGEDKFRGVFKLKYSGDAYIVLQTKVQVSLPLRLFQAFKLFYLFSIFCVIHCSCVYSELLLSSLLLSVLLFRVTLSSVLFY
jgi:mitochondrial distribution and morphology protein 34